MPAQPTATSEPAQATGPATLPDRPKEGRGGRSHPFCVNRLPQAVAVIGRVLGGA